MPLSPDRIPEKEESPFVWAFLAQRGVSSERRLVLWLHSRPLPVAGESVSLRSFGSGNTYLSHLFRANPHLFNPLSPHSWGTQKNAEGLRPSARHLATGSGRRLDTPETGTKVSRRHGGWCGILGAWMSRGIKGEAR